MRKEIWIGRLSRDEMQCNFISKDYLKQMATETSGSKKFDVLRFCELLKQGDDENAIMYFCDMRGYESMM